VLGCLSQKCLDVTTACAEDPDCSSMVSCLFKASSNRDYDTGLPLVGNISVPGWTFCELKCINVEVSTGMQEPSTVKISGGKCNSMTQQVAQCSYDNQDCTTNTASDFFSQTNSPLTQSALELAGFSETTGVVQTPQGMQFSGAATVSKEVTVGDEPVLAWYNCSHGFRSCVDNSTCTSDGRSTDCVRSTVDSGNCSTPKETYCGTQGNKTVAMARRLKGSGGGVDKKTKSTDFWVCDLLTVLPTHNRFFFKSLTLPTARVLTTPSPSPFEIAGRVFEPGNNKQG
jgi:hypothetical protein